MKVARRCGEASRRPGPRRRRHQGRLDRALAKPIAPMCYDDDMTDYRGNLLAAGGFFFTVTPASSVHDRCHGCAAGSPARDPDPARARCGLFHPLAADQVGVLAQPSDRGAAFTEPRGRPGQAPGRAMPRMINGFLESGPGRVQRGDGFRCPSYELRQRRSQRSEAGCKAGMSSFATPHSSCDQRMGTEI
jgi:hypothetical protein